MMSGRPSLSKAARSSGTRVRCPAASVDRPITWTSAVDGAPRRLGGASQRARPPATSKPRSAEARGYDLLAAVMPVLTRLADVDLGGAPVVLGEGGDKPAQLNDGVGVAGPSWRRCRSATCGTAAWRPNTSSIAIDISPTVACARAASIESANRLASPTGHLGAESRAPPRSAPRRDPRADERAWRSGARARRGLSITRSSSPLSPGGG